MQAIISCVFGNAAILVVGEALLVNLTLELQNTKKLWLKFRKPRYLKSKRDEICNRSNKFKLLEKYISFVVVVVLIFSHQNLTTKSNNLEIYDQI